MILFQNLLSNEKEMNMVHLHSQSFALITTRIDKPRVHVPTGPLISVRRVKDIPNRDKNQKRAGVIVYTIRDGLIYFGLGVDADYGALTDFSGGIRYSIEDTLTGALREFQEESLGVFGDISREQLDSSLAVYSESMMTIFIYVHCDMNQICSIFQNSYVIENNPEIREIQWLTKRQFFNKIHQKDPHLMYHKVYELLSKAYQEHGDFVYFL